MAVSAKDTVEEEALAGLMGPSDTSTGSFLSPFNISGGRVLDVLAGGAACAGSAWDILAKRTPIILTGKIFLVARNFSLACNVGGLCSDFNLGERIWR